MYQFSEQSLEYQARLTAFMDEHIYPNEHRYEEQLAGAGDRFAAVPLMDELKAKAREAGLWNLFVPPKLAEFCDHDGLSNFDYAPLAEIMGRVLWCPEVFNCNAPDTGNMEVFMKYGTPEQQAQWLTPLLNGEIRSSYAMTEPQVASSDATNVELRIERDGDEWVLNGRKWFITGAMYERTQIFIVMGKSDPDNENRHKQQSQVLVPRDTPGVEIVRPLTTLGYDDAPLGHAEMRFTDVRVPLENMLLGEGRGFEIAQGRLGPGRIHHCMRLIGQAEVALEEREVLAGELILESLRGGGDDRPALSQRNGHEVGERLPGARSRPRDEMEPPGHRVVHGGLDYSHPVLVDAAVLEEVLGRSQLDQPSSTMAIPLDRDL